MKSCCWIFGQNPIPQFFPQSEKYTNSKVSDKIKKLADKIMTSLIVKKGSGTFSWLTHRCQVYNQLRISWPIGWLFQIRPRTYFSRGGIVGKVSVKRTDKNVWPSSGVVFESRRIISNQKMGKCLAGAALYRSWMVYHHGHILRNK